MIIKIFIGIFILLVLTIAFLGITNTDLSFKINSQDDVPQVSVEVGDKYMGPVPLGYNISKFRETGELIRGNIKDGE